MRRSINTKSMTTLLSFILLQSLTSAQSDSEAVPPCTICPNGVSIALPEQPLNLGAELSFVDSCGTLDIVIGAIAGDSEECALIQSVGSLCGCPVREDACSLCHGGGSVSLLDEDLSWMIQNDNIPDGIVPTCQLIEAMAQSYMADSQQCAEVQVAAGPCGCPPLPQDEGCAFCPNDDATGITKPDQLLEIAIEVVGFAPTCAQADLILSQIYAFDSLCSVAIDVNYLCGCGGGQRKYVGADTIRRYRALVWVPRVSAFLSIMGSLFIIWDALRDKIKRKSVYHTLMVAMSVFDIFGSTAWGLSSLPIPQYDVYGNPASVYGARGNDSTCTAQGFFIQLGYTSMFYNMSLSFYYLMVIRYSLREHQVNKYRVFIFLPPLIVGLALACAGIPHYENVLYGCYIAPPPIAPDYVNLVVFAVLPICVAILTLTVNMVAVYAAVRQQAIKASRWRGTPSLATTNAADLNTSAVSLNPTDSHETPTAPRNSRTWSIRGSALFTRSLSSIRRTRKPQNAIDRMERQTFWQAIAYLAAFYVTWPILLASNLSRDIAVVFPFMIVALAMAPLQGFLNFVVYIRPRVQQHLRERKKRAKQRREEQRSPEISTESEGASNSAKGVEDACIEDSGLHVTGAYTCR